MPARKMLTTGRLTDALNRVLHASACTMMTNANHLAHDESDGRPETEVPPEFAW